MMFTGIGVVVYNILGKDMEPRWLASLIGFQGTRIRRFSGRCRISRRAVRLSGGIHVGLCTCEKLSMQ